MDYTKKYLKYKLKYLNLKKLYGGAEIDRTKTEIIENLNILFKSKNMDELINNYEEILKHNINFLQTLFEDDKLRDIFKFKYDEHYYIMFDSNQEGDDRYKIIKKINNDQYKLLEYNDPNIEEIINEYKKVYKSINEEETNLLDEEFNLQYNIDELLKKDENANKEKNEYLDEINKIKEKLEKLYKEHYIEIDNNDG